MLKFRCFPAFSLILLAATTSVSATTLMRKSTVPGFVMQEFSLYTTCTLDDKGIVTTTNQLNGLISSKAASVHVSVESLKDAITEAALGTIKKPALQIADMPVTTYVAYQKLDDVRLKRVFLYEDNGNQDNSTYNESSKALMLRNFMDALCK